MGRRAFLASIFAAALALYTFTLHGDVQPADSGEFQVAGWLLGVPHAPGYPLHTLLTWLISRVPAGAPFARMAFLSSLAGAGTLAFVAATVLQLSAPVSRSTLRYLAAALSALVLGTSTTFWAQATTVNIRSVTVFFAAFILWACACVAQRRGMWPILGLAIGLGVGHHISLAPVALIVLAAALLATGNWRGLILCLAVAAACQVMWLYLPLRDAAGARFAPGTLGTPGGLWFHISGSGFEGDQLYFLRQAPELFWHRLALVPTLLQFQFGRAMAGLIGLVIASWLLVSLIRRQKPEVAASGEHPTTGRAVNFRILHSAIAVSALVHLFITLMYRAPQTVEYALPVWAAASVVFGSAFARVLAALEWRGTTASAIGRLLQMLLILVGFVTAAEYAVTRLPSFLAQPRDHTVRERATRVLENAAPGSVVLAQWHEATPMWALQDVENFRRDVRVLYVPPAGAQPYAETFAQRARAERAQTVAYATSYFATEFAQAGLSAIPQNNIPAWELYAHPLTTTLATTRAQAVFDGRIGVVSAKLAEPAAAQGGAVEVILATLAFGKIEEGDSVTVRVMRPDGRLGANVDFRLDPAAKPGEVQFQRKLLGLPRETALPGPQQVLAGAYNGGRVFAPASGGPYVPVASLEVLSSSTRTPGVHFADALALHAVRAWREGGNAVVELDWLALRDLHDDYVVSVRLTDPRDGRLAGAQDGVPALGAIPTLKWRAGSRITDRHVVPLQGSTGPLSGRVIVYNSRDRVALPVTAGDLEEAPMFEVVGDK